MADDDGNDFNRGVIEDFRANDGKTSGPFADAPLMLMTTTGAKSGQLRTTPMMYLREGDRLFVFASKAGAPTHPDWFHNLLADPVVAVEIGDQTYQALAKPVIGEERDQIYARWAEKYPQFRAYQEKTTRIIPVIELEPHRT